LEGIYKIVKLENKNWGRRNENTVQSMTFPF